MIEISTQKEALRHTAKRMTIAVCLSAVMTLAAMTSQLGTNLAANVQVGYVMMSSLCVAVFVSAFLAGLLSYRSALLMKDLTLTKAELFRISRTDQLTGLLNRRGFDEAATAGLQRAYEEALPAVGMMCDIDHFKRINDQFGHEFGDRVLIAISELLRLFAADNGLLVARYGGEEFAIFAVGATAEQAMIYAEALRNGCSAPQIFVEGSPRVTISVGVATPENNPDLSVIMRMADEALYNAKNRGRNCVSRSKSLLAPLVSNTNLGRRVA